MMLTKDETTIGRAEACDIGLFGDNAIEKLHARIVQKGNRYLLADDDTPGGTFLNDASGSAGRRRCSRRPDPRRQQCAALRRTAETEAERSQVVGESVSQQLVPLTPDC